MIAPEPELAKVQLRSGVIRAIGLTTVVTAAGYAVTLFQQVLYARSLGVNVETDALGAALAWAVGTTGLVGTTLSSVFLPSYIGAGSEVSAARGALGRATRISLGVGGSLAIATFLGAPAIAQVLTPGGDTPTHEFLVTLLRVAAVLEITWPLVWLSVAIVNAHERYVLAASSWLLPPIPVIVVLATGNASPTTVMAGYVAGTVLQLVALWAVDPRSRPTLRPAGRPATGGGTQDLLIVGAAFALFSAIPILVRALASLSGPGSVAIADYASRLVLAGQQVLLSGLLAVTFTRWSQLAAGPGRARAGVLDSVDRTLLVVLAGAIATAVLLPVLAVDLTGIILTGGRFTSADAVGVGTFVAWMAPGVGGHMVLMVALRALLAERRHEVVIAAASTAVLVMLGVGVVAASSTGLSGVAIGYSAGYIAAAGIAFAAVWRRRGPANELDGSIGASHPTSSGAVGPAREEAA